jgi:hypothetical protein
MAPGSTGQGSLLSTTAASFLKDGKLVETKIVDQVTVALRPSVVCLNPLDPSAPVYVVTPSFKALDGQEFLDPEDLKPKLRAQLHRENVEVLEGCMPPGRFQSNLVYGTGQAWTIPNEAGECIPPLEMSEDGRCFQQGISSRRLLLNSQTTVVRIGDERQPGFCESTFGDRPDYTRGIPNVCLRADEIEKLRKSP